MLNKLHEIESLMPELLRQDDGLWNSLFVDYHHPFVERLWRNIGEDTRVYPHFLYPCETHEALLHPHPWPSAIRILKGRYEMGIGYGERNIEPPIIARIILSAGDEYEMTDPNGWHYVRPLDDVVVSLMVTGKPWGRVSPKSEYPLKELTKEQKTKMLTFFKNYYLK